MGDLLDELLEHWFSLSLEDNSPIPPLAFLMSVCQRCGNDLETEREKKQLCPECEGEETEGEP